MRTAYFDCIAGASGDMILGALLDAGLDLAALKAELAKLPIQGWDVVAKRVEKICFAATKADVLVSHQPHSRALPEIEGVITRSRLSDRIKREALVVIRMIAAEEARIHGMEIASVHLHEVSGEDAIIDIVGALVAIELMGIERVVCSPLPLGRGFIQGAHGQIPLPAPATVGLLKGVPVVGSSIQAELVTPTGAALMKHLAHHFGELPAMRLDQVGYGAGTHDLPIPNLLRVFIGEADGSAFTRDTVTVLETNIDDQNPEQVAHLMERAFEEGALDVTMTPTQMKKSRGGVVMSVITMPERTEALRSLILTESSSLGVREQSVRRSVLLRDRVEVETPWGKTFVKIGHLPNGQHKYAPEFEDCRVLARKAGVPLREVYVAAETAARYVHEGTGHKHQ
jgi:pyridinium-3,5-bisthiocarboxylic acid mononucleotide nickel chelatase